MARREPSIEDLDFEIRFCEGILRRNENFLPALTLLAELYTRRGLQEKGLYVDQRLAKLQPQDPIVFYNLACSYALLNRIDEALATIKSAIALGYNDFAHMGQDEDLANLFKDSRFKEYLTRLRDRAVTSERPE